jgi:N6-adenosine-specific RNA methylase IME4
MNAVVADLFGHNRQSLEADRVAWLNRCPWGGDADAIHWRLPDDLTRDDVINLGRALGTISRSVGWWLGDWYVQAEARFGGMKDICEAADVNYATARNYAVCCRSFPTSSRRDTVSFKHHLVLAGEPEDVQTTLLAEAIKQGLSAAQLHTRIKQLRRTAREQELGDATRQAAAELGKLVANVIYVDPPWRFEPWSRETGMDRAADNHYSTETLDRLAELVIPAAEDCAMFMWATVPMLDQAMDLLRLWGFRYKSNFVWVKDKAGTGYWNRNCHELLLVGTRGTIPAPAPGEQYPSVIEARIHAHSAKPAQFAEMIEEMFPNAVLLEMFARGPRLGWQVWGNEAAAA